MTREQLLNQYKVKTWNETILTEIEKNTEQYLALYPHDTEFRLRLAVLETVPPLCDYGRSITFSDSVLEYEPQHFQALALSVHNNLWYYGELNKTTLNLLMNFETNEKEISAIKDYLIADFYYAINDTKNYEKYLNSSVKYYPFHVNNLLQLAKIHKKNNAVIEANNLIKKALQNIQTIYSPNSISDLGSYTNFIAEHITGTLTTQNNYNELKALLEEEPNNNQLTCTKNEIYQLSE